MELRIFNCVDNDDVEGLQLLLDYPNIFQIEDRRGYTILQTAILMGSKKVFDFLLSLDDCPINARNRRGKTALDVALLPGLRFSRRSFYRGHRNHFDYFANSLVEKGADFDYVPGRASLLHRALRAKNPRLAKLLIQKGADLNCQDEKGQTPLLLAFKLGQSLILSNIMLDLGADPLIPDNEGYRVIDYAFKYHYFFLSKSMQNHLVFYFFDDYCTGYKIPVDILFELLIRDSPIAPLHPQILKYITSVNLDKNSFGSLHYFFNDLLMILKPEYLILLLEKFDYVIESIIDATLDYGWEKSYKHLEKIDNYKNFHLLFQSRFSSDIIKIVNETGIPGIINFVRTKINRNLIFSTELFDLIFVLLSYGANIYDQDVEYIYQTFGDCEFFRTLLHMDIKVINKNRQRDIMPALLYNVDMDIETFLNAPRNYSLGYLVKVLNYFAHPKLKNFCCSLPIQNEDVHAKIKDLPSVPLLVELARNEARKFLIKKYKIKNSRQFYTLIKRLPISKVHQKIITFETKLY